MVCCRQAVKEGALKIPLLSKDLVFFWDTISPSGLIERHVDFELGLGTLEIQTQIEDSKYSFRLQNAFIHCF